MVELCFGLRVVRLFCVFVVNLPAEHIRIAPEALYHLLGNLARQFAVFGVGEIKMLTIAMLSPAAVLIHAESFRVLLREPSGWGRRWRAKNCVDAVFRGSGDRTLQPIQVELTLAWFHATPCELAHPHHTYAGLFHQRQVRFPAGLGPLLGIPSGPQEESWRWRHSGLALEAEGNQ